MSKRDALIARLVDLPEPQLVPLDAFFDGNTDLGSIGCNLPEHPGIDAFRRVLAAVAARPDVRAVHVQIAELDPGPECWPFADTVLVVGSVAPEVLAEAVRELQPDEVSELAAEDVPATCCIEPDTPVHVLWWD